MSLGAIGSAWAAWFLPAGLQALALILVAAALDRPLRRRGWPELAHGLWLLVPVRLLLPPALLTPFATSLPHSSTLTGLGVPVSAPKTAEWLGAAALCWAAGALVLTVVRLRGASRDRRRTRAAARAAPDSLHRRLRHHARRLRLRRPPALMISSAVTVPAVSGLQPTIVLPPEAADELDGETLDHVLLHELVHVRRGDLWAERLFLLARILYWPLPFLARARRRARHAREMCCDATVAAHLGAGSRGYRRTLLTLALRAPGGSPAGAALLDGRSRTLDRILALERPAPAGVRSRRLAALALTLALAALLLPLDATPVPGGDPPGPESMRGEVEAALRGNSSLLLRNAVRGLHAVSGDPRTDNPTERIDP